jgi:hypothetical protein
MFLGRNPDARSIEAELEEAMYKAGGIAEANRGNQGKVGWQRCARTDKGDLLCFVYCYCSRILPQAFMLSGRSLASSTLDFIALPNCCEALGR